MIDALASLPHYLDHLAPLWRGLPPEVRGELVVPDQLVARAEKLGLANVNAVRQRPVGERVIVAAAVDLQRLERHAQAVLVEHGAGQTYKGVDHVGYPGGRHRDRVGLFLCPSPRVAALNLARYPDAHAAVVGCPRLDRWADHHRVRREPFEVVVSFHWDCGIVPEAGSAWQHWRPHLLNLRVACEDQGWRLLAHAHPRQRDVRLWADYVGVEYVEEIEEVLERAAVYVCDNSSTMYEAVATGLPVVALNCPDYRRHVEHGLRFWSLPPGPQADEPHELLEHLHGLLDHEPGVGATWGQAYNLGTRAAHEVYAFRDGTAGARSVEAVLEWLDQ